MSEDLIRRSDAIKVVRHSSMEFIDADTRQKLIEAIPTIDAVPKEDYEALQDAFNRTYNALKDIEPKRGEWVDTHKMYYGSTVYACSVCKSEIEEMPTFYEKPMYKWCPYCGADMRGKDDE